MNTPAENTPGPSASDRPFLSAIAGEQQLGLRRSRAFGTAVARPLQPSNAPRRARRETGVHADAHTATPPGTRTPETKTIKRHLTEPPRPPAPVRSSAPTERSDAADELRAVLLESVRRLDDPLALERFSALTRLRAVQERAARHYRDDWCAVGRALRDVLRAAVEPVAEVLPPPAAATLRALAEGHTAASVAQDLGLRPPALRKRVTPQIEDALARYLEHLERRDAA